MADSSSTGTIVSGLTEIECLVDRFFDLALVFQVGERINHVLDDQTSSSGYGLVVDRDELLDKLILDLAEHRFSLEDIK